MKAIRFFRGLLWHRHARKNVQGTDGQAIADQFHRLYYDLGATGKTWSGTYWFGVQICKFPQELIAYQEMLFDVQPHLIVETGTAFGGSALFLAHMCDLIGRGLVLSVDTTDRKPPGHPRIQYKIGSSISPSIVQDIGNVAKQAGSVLVILDSDHSRGHVLRELKLYSPMVTMGSYLVVEDTNVNGHPVYPEHGPGPHEAVEEFLRYDTGFQIDKTKEKFLVTQNPDGYLKRVEAAVSAR